MKKPKICAVIVNNNLNAIREVEPLVDLFEVRIDLIGTSWAEIARQLRKPWIACNRRAEEGGKWSGNEARRIEELLRAMEMGASMVDIELETRGLSQVVPLVKKRTKCLVSSHNLEKTPSFEELKEIVQRQLKAGADIGKIVTTARTFEDNATVLKLIPEFPEAKLIAFAMGPLGTVSRVLCPLLGGELTYASIEKGKESAEGQITVKELIKIYEMAFHNLSP